MHTTDKEQAETLRRALALDLVEGTEVLAWIDEVMRRDAAPSALDCEMSILGSEDREALLEQLAKVPGAFDRERVQRMFLKLVAQRMRERLETGRWTALQAAMWCDDLDAELGDLALGLEPLTLVARLEDAQAVGGARWGTEEAGVRAILLGAISAWVDDDDVRS